MTPQEFVEVVKVQASDGAAKAVVSCLEAPPGRRPSQRDLELSRWYLSISPEHQFMVREIIREAAQQAVFSFLALLDGVAALGKEHQAGRLKIFYSEGEQERLLNESNQEELHNMFNIISTRLEKQIEQAYLEAYEVGEALSLLRKSVPGDGLEIHHVPQKDSAGVQIPEYDDRTAPAMALPKAEHRRMPPR